MDFGNCQFHNVFPTVYKYVSEWLYYLSLWGGQLHIVFPTVYNYVFEGLCCWMLWSCQVHKVYPMVCDHVFEGLCCLSLWNCQFHNVFRRFASMGLQVYVVTNHVIISSIMCSEGFRLCV